MCQVKIEEMGIFLRYSTPPSAGGKHFKVAHVFLVQISRFFLISGESVQDPSPKFFFIELRFEVAATSPKIDPPEQLLFSDFKP